MSASSNNDEQFSHNVSEQDIWWKCTLQCHLHCNQTIIQTLHGKTVEEIHTVQKQSFKEKEEKDMINLI